MVKKIFSFFLFFLTLTFTLTTPIFAQDTINLANSASQFNRIYNLRPSQFVASAINLLLGISGVAAFLYLLWGGLQLITAGGDKDAVEKGRRRIMWALIGLSVVFSAYAIMYIIQVLFRINLINFTINPI